ncbi:hypothetical protein Cni_G22340 [Canna indica]|uniref:Uncharacterized protein n=1 Tax=Canna indica TaxID=4628 RepID=A0AAQ3KRT9_9LILI|nr:hypothetical protein Cni_G22340 [Canna indica]
MPRFGSAPMLRGGPVPKRDSRRLEIHAAKENHQSVSQIIIEHLTKQIITSESRTYAAASCSDGTSAVDSAAGAQKEREELLGQRISILPLELENVAEHDGKRTLGQKMANARNLLGKGKKSKDFGWLSLKNEVYFNGYKYEKMDENRDSLAWEDVGEISDTIKTRGQSNVMAVRIKDAMLNKTSMMNRSSLLKHRDEMKLTQSIGPSKIRREESPSKLSTSIHTPSSLSSKVADVKLYSIDDVVENESSDKSK